MNQSVLNALSSTTLDSFQSYFGITIFPILTSIEAPSTYLSLGEALSRELIMITEISDSGSVPELQVKNSADVPVLILDGEELRGAKQNRVINTTVLLREQSETVIPVSCTEQGRWSYTSSHFEDSDVIMAKEVRSKKSRSVSASLRSSDVAMSDQGLVWDEVRKLHDKLGTHSPTGAMRDSYSRHEGSLKERLSHFPCVERQTGLIALAKGKVIGMDILSNTSVYEQVHSRLLKSYVIDLLGDPQTDDELDQRMVAENFLASLPSLTESQHPSVGYGTDFRYQSESVCGSSLVHDGIAVHVAFFTDTSASPVRENRRYSARQRGPQPNREPPQSGSASESTRPRSGQVDRSTNRPHVSRQDPKSEMNSRPPSSTAEDQEHIREEAERKRAQRMREGEAVVKEAEEQRKRRIEAHSRWTQTFLKLSPLKRLELIAWDTTRDLGYFPAASAEVSSNVIKEFERDTLVALYQKIKDRRKGPWNRLAEVVRERVEAP